MNGKYQTSARPFDPSAFGAALFDAKAAIPFDCAAARGATAMERFAVYRNNVVQGLIDALAVRFATVRAVVGAELFAHLAHVYALAHPPRLPMMMFYGEDFADFLADSDAGAELPYLADLARLEAARTSAYHAEDAAPLPAEAFADLAPDGLEGLRIALHPSLSIIASPFPVATIFAMHCGMLPLAAIEDWHGEEIAVVRPQMSVEVHTLPAGGAGFLDSLARRATLAEAAAAGLAQTQGFDLAAALAALIRFGLATEISKRL